MRLDWVALSGCGRGADKKAHAVNAGATWRVDSDFAYNRGPAAAMEYENVNPIGVIAKYDKLKSDSCDPIRKAAT
ncbi:MAG TPA: hypothetical protein VFB20_04205 [Burkholderiales bacterium]|nr:hypothetical protein [Burkholderiales bacterium]